MRGMNSLRVFGWFLSLNLVLAASAAAGAFGSSAVQDSSSVGPGSGSLVGDLMVQARTIGVTALAASGATRGAGAGARGLRLIQAGDASWYGPGLQGNSTAIGETFDQYRVSAAMFRDRNGNRLRPPFWVRVECVGASPTSTLGTNPCRRRFLDVRVNDTGPFAKSGGRVIRPLQQYPGRAIDLSRAAMLALQGQSGRANPRQGLVAVRVYFLRED